jgi:hypothetical protein
MEKTTDIEAASTLTSAPESEWWAPRRPAWRIAVLFSIGSICFLLGPLPGFASLVGATADGVVFFVGSIFFTSAALLQYREAANADLAPGERKRLFRVGSSRTDWWAALVQLVGTVYFNVDTYRALQTSIDVDKVDRLIWTPDAIGSICFLVSGMLSFWEVRRAPRRSLDWRIGVINLLGCILFGISAIATYVVPSTGDILALAAANWTTSLGALCFLIGAVLLIPADWRVRSSRSP